MERLNILAKQIIASPTKAAPATAGEQALSPWGTTAGAPPPFAANGGAPWLMYDLNGDGGAAAASEEAFKQLATGTVQETQTYYKSQPPGGIKTKWGVGFKTYEECIAHINANPVELDEGAVYLPLRYTVDEEPSYSHVGSNQIWKGASGDLRMQLKKIESQRACLYFPQVLRDARRMEKYYPGLSPFSAECMDKLGVSLAHLETKCTDIFNAHEVEAVYYPEIEKLLLDFFPGATDALVYNHDCFDQDNPRKEDQDNKDPGVNGGYANLVHNDLNDNSGRVRCKELLTKNLRNFGRQIEPPMTDEQAEEKMSRRFMSINLAKPCETVQQNPFVLCAWPSFADQPYITNYRIYDDRVGETTRFTHRANHEWYWFPQQQPHEVSMLKCYDSITDGSVSRWSFHSACVDPTAPEDAPHRKNLVVRSYVFF